MNHREVGLSAFVRLTSTKKSIPLTPYEEWSATLKVPKNAPPEVARAMIDSHFRLQVHQGYVERLKTNPTMKKEIGGIRWFLDVREDRQHYDDNVKAAA